MKTHTLENYLDVIQKLLNCPQGDEWRLIEQSEELVDPELLQVMEGAIEELAREGDLRSANYLRYWQAQLARILKPATKIAPPETDRKARAYLELIGGLLDRPEGSRSELLAVNEGLIDPGLVQMMRQMATQTLERGDRETASYLNNLATEIEQNYLKANKASSQLDSNSKNIELSVEELNSAEDPWIQGNGAREIESKQELQKQSNDPDNEEISASILDLNSLENTSQLETKNNQTIEQQLTAIAQSLKKLEEILVSRPQPTDPLWYMDVLERASASQWILTTEEIEKLTGVKPKCKANQNSYQRGCWLFVKAGKMGAQIGWQVIKQIQDFSRN
jgi:hypothetical protein